MNFNIENDFEFYCFLKANLPNSYKIISEPSKNYYSEWQYDYKIFHKNILIEEIKGNFKEIEDGELVRKAIQIINKLKS